MYDPPDYRHYLDVCNEIAAGIERQRSLPPRILAPSMWRRLIIQALTVAQLPNRMIANILNVDVRTVQRERKQPLP
jgi:FixJ family two-component response regulator